MGKKLFVGVPIHGAVNTDFYQSSLRFIQQVDFPCMLTDVIGDSAVGRARNTLTRKFLESDATELLFIDSDLVFSVDHVKRILSHDVELVGGMYPKKQQEPVAWVINTLDDQPSGRPDRLCEVKYVGTGFMKISRCVFEKMIKAFGSEIAYISDHDHKTLEYDFWHMGVYEYPDGHRRYLSEDWWFCQMWRDLGGKVWADQAVILRHSGQILYPLKHQEEEIFRHCRASSPNSPNASGDSVSPSAVPLADLQPRQMQPA